jgi:hypothetical protein
MMGERGFGEGGEEAFGVGQVPIETAQAYVDEKYAGASTGWRVEELSGDVNFGMVTVVIGRYLPSGDIESRVDGVEGHGQTIEAAVDDALGANEG